MTKKCKKILSFVLSASFILVCIPTARVFAAGKSILPANRPTHQVLYTNNFENSETYPIASNPSYQIKSVGTGHALFFTQPLNESNQYELYADFLIPSYHGDLYPDTTVNFDVILPKNAVNFNGNILGDFEFYDNGYWKSASWNAPSGSVEASDFKDLGNGYCSARMSVSIYDLTSAENATRLRIAVYGTAMGRITTNYSGLIGIDNIVFTL